MERQVAADILRCAYSLDRDLGTLDGIISGIADPAAKAHYVKSLGNLMGAVARDFIFPITKEYPDLDADHQGGTPAAWFVG